MRHPLPLVLTLSVLVACTAGPRHVTAGPVPDVAALDSWCAAPAPRQVVESLADWRDEARDRTLPVKLYLPSGADACPVVLLSHGLGGNREALAYLARPWAQRGFLCVTLQHPGSDEGVWKDERPLLRMRALRLAIRDPRNALDRAADVTFALDRLAALHADPASPLRGRVDLERVAVCGHSFGAWTALTAGGRLLVAPGGASRDLGDRRVDCVVSLSGQPANDPERDRIAHAALKRPTLHLTGTLDDSPISDTKAADRRIPFDLAPGPAQGGAPQYLGILEGGDHMVFSGEHHEGRLRERAGDPARDPALHRAIRAVATAFVEAYLRDDAAARAFLDDDAGYRSALGDLGTFERKP